MQIVINISDDDYRKVQDGRASVSMMQKAIRNGTPLPKGHGDLKDISKIDYQSGCFISSEGEPLPIIHKIATIEMIRDWLPTIIEADKAESEESDDI